MRDHHNPDFALETAKDLFSAVMLAETLLGPHTLDRYRAVCFAFADEEKAMSVDQLRLALQVEDNLDWLLRKDLPRIQLWRAESRLKDALDVSKQIADLWQALGICLGRYALGAEDWIKTPDQETGLLPLTIAVALRCHVNELRWRARAELPCDVPLKALHRLYAMAEMRNIATQKVYPYESDVDFSISPKEQYVLMLLMADLAQRDLTPTQRLISQSWLSSWAHDVELDLAPVAGKHSMRVNLDSAEGMERIVGTAHATTRFLDVRAIAKHIEETDAYLSNSDHEDAITRDLGGATVEDFADTMTLLEKLYHDRSAGFQAVRTRHAASPNRFARVIIGWNYIQEFIEASTWSAKAGRGTFPDKCPSLKKLGVIGAALAHSADDFPVVDLAVNAAIEERDQENFLRWQIRDESPVGLGLASSQAADSELAVGTLILVSSEGATAWSLGRIVRKFKGLDGTDMRFGIQLLGQDAVPVRLFPRQATEVTKSTQVNSVTGLFLCRPEHPDQQDLMLVSTSALVYTRRFELKTGIKRLAIRAALPVQSAGAWALIEFEEDI